MPSPSASKSLNLPLITFGTVLATFMQALDATIANVALPYMQGGFSASQDQASWILTSYIVAAAIMTPPTGWLSNRYGRKKLFLVSIAAFVVASVLCGLASSLYEMVAFRVLQGMGGAALVPLSQSVLLDSFPKERHGSAMAVWGMGAVVGPVLGPTLGGWLTDHYSWRWVFYINVPFGVLAFLVISAAVAETKVDKGLRFDALGFGLISLAIASLQMFLDRGEQLDWFGSTEIVVEAALAALAFYLFVVHIFTTDKPFISPRLFRDRNFSVSLIFISVVGIILFATMALMPPMLQGLMGYPVFTIGLLLAPRGVGTIMAMVLVGRLLQRLDARYLIVFGLAVSAYSFYWMSAFPLVLPQWDVALSGVIQGFGLGFVWVPLTTIAYSTITPEARNEAAGVFNLMRNIGASAGISMVVALLAQNTQRMHSALATNVAPTNPLFLDPAIHRFWNLATPEGVAAINAEVTRQAAMIAYIDDFKLMMLLALALIPMVLLFSAPPRAAAGAAAMAVE